MSGQEIEVLDADLVDGVQPTETSMALAERQTRGDLAVAPEADAGQLVARLDVIRTAMQEAMQEGIDYGRIPGVSKPTLLKPGAEKLGVLFQLDLQFIDQETYGPDDHLTVKSEATVFHAPTSIRLGAGTGVCSTREKKYGKRQQARSCPQCGKDAIIKGKAEYGGGWLCFKKKDGCGAKFADDDVQILGQAVGEIPNPDLPDTWNTVLKMARKRARVDAILAVTGASALFTQDAEDLGTEKPATPPATQAEETPPQGTAAGVTRDQALRIGELRATVSDDALRGLLGMVGLMEIGDDLNAALPRLTRDQAGDLVALMEDASS